MVTRPFLVLSVSFVLKLPTNETFSSCVILVGIICKCVSDLIVCCVVQSKKKHTEIETLIIFFAAPIKTTHSSSKICYPFCWEKKIIFGKWKILRFPTLCTAELIFPLKLEDRYKRTKLISRSPWGQFPNCKKTRISLVSSCIYDSHYTIFMQITCTYQFVPLTT